MGKACIPRLCACASLCPTPPSPSFTSRVSRPPLHPPPLLPTRRPRSTLRSLVFSSRSLSTLPQRAMASASDLFCSKMLRRRFSAKIRSSRRCAAHRGGERERVWRQQMCTRTHGTGRRSSGKTARREAATIQAANKVVDQHESGLACFVADPKLRFDEVCRAPAGCGGCGGGVIAAPARGCRGDGLRGTSGARNGRTKSHLVCQGEALDVFVEEGREKGR